ncbi:MAG: IPTL-CTERM sorting domain-containing protein [bacterium]|nr:IPTL-CTERM sorting domain-containing protein [bacterium]
MRQLINVGIAVAVLMLGAAVAQGQTLYGTGHTGSDGPANFYTVNPLTGTGTLVGAVGFERCGALACDANGVLYAACERSDGSDTPVLITINPVNGAGTEVGVTSGGGSTGPFSDISFRNADGALYGYDAANDPQHTIYTIDPGSGALTLIGDTGLSAASGNGLSFDLTDTLFHSQNTGVVDLNTIDQMNGAAALVTTLPIAPPATNFYRFNAMDAHPTTGQMFASLNDSGGGAGLRTLATIDTGAGTVTLIGALPDDFDGLAWCPAPAGPMVNTIDIPTLSGAGLALLALLILGGAVWVLRRRA